MYPRAAHRTPAWLTTTLLALGLLLHAPAQAMEIRIPRPESGLDTRSRYQIELLQLALNKVGAHDTVKPTAKALTQADVVQALAADTGAVTLAWFTTTPEREATLLPIRIPIDKGLIGWRIALVKADRFDRFREVRSGADLKKFVAVQGSGWPDTDILRANGLKVIESPDYEKNFQLVAAHKVDYFPRSVIEYRAELEDHRELGLVEEPYMVLRYPAASYFFLPKSQTELAEKIRKGLEIALRDGSFDRLFYQHHSQYIETVGLERRHVVKLKNPNLSPQTPLSRKELWFRPETMQP